MPLLTITAKGQITLKRELLQHMGLRPGDQIEVEPGPRGRLEMGPVEPRRPLAGLVGILPSNGRRASLEEIQRAIEEGWAGQRED
jgi:antitoxin PrlF